MDLVTQGLDLSILRLLVGHVAVGKFVDLGFFL
jgi:hypothetical protein